VDDIHLPGRRDSVQQILDNGVYLEAHILDGTRRKGLVH
jgi:hypothetical protein